MIIQGFDPLEHTMSEFVEFCERLERTEQFSATSNTPPNSNNHGNGNKKRRRQSTGNGSQTSSKSFYCLLHGQNATHTTEQCKTIKKMAQDKKKEYAAKSNSRGKPLFNQKELNALAKIEATRMLRSAVQKRKAERQAAMEVLEDPPKEEKSSDDLYAFSSITPEEHAYLNTINGDDNIRSHLDALLD